MLLFSDMLYMLVRYASPSGPMYLMCLFTFSCPVKLLFLLCFITSWTCVIVFSESFVERVYYLCG